MSLHIEHHGNPDGQPLVLLHGWGLSSDIWHSWLPALESDYRLLLVDLPGLGRSGFNGGQSIPGQSDAGQTYHLDAVTDQIIEQLQPLLNRPAVWLGWSLGGLVAASIADKLTRAAPTSIAGLITVATNPCFVQRTDWTEAMPNELFESFQQSLQSNPLKTLNRFSLLQGQGDPHARQLVKILKPIAAACADQADHLAESLALLDGDYRDLFASLNLPRLFLFADNDALVPATVAQQPLLAERSLQLADAGHVPFITAETALTPLIKNWLQELNHD